MSSILTEDKKAVDIGKGKSVYFHRAHVPGTQDHLHFYQKDSKLFALNRDGTAHDKSHQYQMPNWAKEAVKTHYPDFTIPVGGLIESLLADEKKDILVETNSEKKPLVAEEHLRDAESKCG
ncbi:hypothetical protein [Gluconacetobacter diazotrophicus]|uniref:hypothetical protein n=1 Tax=Gluconacetobacter diazotrophicus TaxID=33996 RepID=UPI0012FEA43B|nr:hypothetical protein [Gluconacetobacter diazotrophicus]